MIIDEVGHAEEFLDRLHHFGRFCSEQLAIQHQDLQGARQGGEVSVTPSPALLRQESTFTTPSVILEPNLPPACPWALLNTNVPWCSLTLMLENEMQLKPGPGLTQDNIRASAQSYPTHRQLGLQHSNYTSSRQLIRLYKVNRQWKNHSGIDPILSNTAALCGSQQGWHPAATFPADSLNYGELHLLFLSCSMLWDSRQGSPRGVCGQE